MDFDIQHRPSYSLAVVKLTAYERIRVETGAMVSMSENITLETRAEGGIFKSLTRAVLGGESFFQNIYQSSSGGGEITLAPDLPGDMEVIQPGGSPLMIQSGSYVASEMGVELNARISMKAFMAAEGLSMIEATGSGKVLVSSYGAIFNRELKAGEKYVVDSSHLVAFDASIHAEPRTAGGLKSTLFSGEGLVVVLTGPGRVWIQTRSPQAFISWIIPHLPKPPSEG